MLQGMQEPLVLGIIWRNAWACRELAELSAETRDIALSRFRPLEPHLEQHSVVAADAGVPFRTAQLVLAVTPHSALTYIQSHCT
jgi:hypothetical protein